MINSCHWQAVIVILIYTYCRATLEWVLIPQKVQCLYSLRPGDIWMFLTNGQYYTPWYKLEGYTGFMLLWVLSIPLSRMMFTFYRYSCKRRDHFVNAYSQWETILQCNIICHWLGSFRSNVGGSRGGGGGGGGGVVDMDNKKSIFVRGMIWLIHMSALRYISVSSTWFEFTIARYSLYFCKVWKNESVKYNSKCFHFFYKAS